MTHTPTFHGPTHTPTTCFLCARHATGLGLGREKNAKGYAVGDDPRWLCELCALLAGQIRSVIKFDKYEDNAVEAVKDSAVAPLVERNGTDMAEWTDEQVTELIVEVVLGYGAAIREQVKNNEVPF